MSLFKSKTKESSIPRPKLKCYDPYLKSSEWSSLKKCLENGKNHYWCSFYICYLPDSQFSNEPFVRCTVYDSPYKGMIVPDGTNMSKDGVVCLKEYNHFDIPQEPTAAYKLIGSEWKKLIIQQAFEDGDNELPDDAYEEYKKIVKSKLQKEKLTNP